MVIVIGFSVMVLSLRAEVDKHQPEARAAVVNGAAIMKDEFDGEILLVQKALLGTGKPLTCSQITSVRKEVMESMIRREILYQESRKSGIKIDQAAISKELDALKKQFLSEAEYKNELNRRNLSEETLRARLERGLSIQQYVERQFAGKVKVTDAEIMAYYENNLDLLKQPLQVRVSHILIQLNSQWEASRKQEARRKAEQILKNLKAGQDFAALAREQSDGPTRTSGGDLGYIKMGQLEKQLESVVLSLKPGETSEVIETSYGFHLFKVIDRKPETILAYDSVKEQIQQYLMQEKAKQEADLQAAALREKAAVEIFLNEDISSAKRP
jgi:peptidyl-prolyl cis-trans isomerase C